MTFSPKINLTKEPRSFKIRSKKRVTKIKFLYGDTLIFFRKSGVLDSAYFKFFKKSLKTFFKKFKTSKTSFKKKKIWFFLSTNFPLTKKSKNSRMGKGKGGFIRWGVRIKENGTFFESRDLSVFFIKILIKKLQHKLPLNLGLKITKKINVIPSKNVI